MTKYIVKQTVVGVPGPPMDVPPVPVAPAPTAPTYHYQGEILEDLDEETAQRLVEQGAIVEYDDAPEELQEQAEQREEDLAKASAVAEAKRIEDERLAAEQAAREQEEREAQEAQQKATKDGVSDDGEPRLTEKQALQKEAKDLGLDPEGTVPQLKARIEDHKARTDGQA